MALADGWAPRFSASRLTAPAHGWPWAEVSTFQGDGPSGLSGPPGSVRGGTAGEKRARQAGWLDTGRGSILVKGDRGHRRWSTLRKFGRGWGGKLLFAGAGWTGAGLKIGRATRAIGGGRPFATLGGGWGKSIFAAIDSKMDVKLCFGSIDSKIDFWKIVFSCDSPENPFLKSFVSCALRK